MKVNKILFLLFTWILMPLIGISQNLNPATSSISFTISNFGINSVEGTISNLAGTADFNENQLELCSFDVCLDMNTIDTGNKKRDEHLKAEDYFNISKHPKTCFTSQEVTNTDVGYLVTGTLQMNGVERTVDIPFAYANKKFTGVFEVDRLDYNIGSSGGFAIGRTVNINITANQN